MELRIAAICCTHGRYTQLQRSIKNFIDQDYKGYHILFICNTGRHYEIDPIVLESLPSNKQIILWNQDNSSYNFTSVGAKYNKALKELIDLTLGIDVVTSWDDDDIFLPNHISEGNIGMNKAYSNYMKAYKPKQSYYRYRDSEGIHISLAENTLEPSIFVDLDYLVSVGYAPVSVKYHQQWLDSLTKIGAILVDPYGTSTLVYNWGDNIPVYKMSGRGTDDSANFSSHKQASIDFGPRILTPLVDVTPFYNEVELFKHSLTNL